MKKIYLLPFVLLLLTACQTSPLTSESTTLSSSPPIQTSTTADLTETIPSSTVKVSESQGISSEKITANDVVLEPIDIYELALENYPELRIYSLGLDKDHIYGFVYEIEGIDEATNQKIELDLHPVSGEIVHKEETLRSKDQAKKELTPAFVVKISSFVDQSLTQVPNAALDEWVAEYEDGYFELEVEIRSGTQKHEFSYNLAD